MSSTLMQFLLAKFGRDRGINPYMLNTREYKQSGVKRTSGAKKRRKVGKVKKLARRVNRPKK